MATNLSLLRILAPRDFEHPILGLSLYKISSSRDHRSLPLVLSDGRLQISRHFATSNPSKSSLHNLLAPLQDLTILETSRNIFRRFRPSVHLLAPLQDLTILRTSRNLFRIFRPSVLPCIIHEVKKGISLQDSFVALPTCDVLSDFKSHLSMLIFSDSEAYPS
jgi:hypothetical protein